MTILDGQTAIMRRIADTPGAPNVVWPDGPGAGLPRYVMQASGGAHVSLSVQGRTQADPEVTVRVETAEGGYTRENTELVNTIIARFPVTRRFDGLTIVQPPNVRPPLLSNGVYAVPVIIRARMFI